jgi:uncharacterized membrane protein
MSRSPRALAAFFIFGGVMHFVRPRAYEAIMPPSFPRHRESVLVSGAAEIAGGVGAALPATRPLARWWLLALLAAVFPANVYMALNPDEVTKRGVPADRIPAALLWARLPVQGLFAWWTWRATDR